MRFSRSSNPDIPTRRAPFRELSGPSVYTHRNGEAGHRELLAGYYDRVKKTGSGTSFLAGTSLELLRVNKWDGTNRMLPASYLFVMRARFEGSEAHVPSLEGVEHRFGIAGFEPTAKDADSISFIEPGSNLLAGVQREGNGIVVVGGMIGARRPFETLEEMVDQPLPYSVAVFNQVFPGREIDFDAAQQTENAAMSVANNHALLPQLRPHLHVVE